MAENPDSRITTYKASGGQWVTLSKDALEIYGSGYINEVAAASGKKRLLLVDEAVLNEAKEQFPGSKSPLIDAYRDYLDDGNDVLASLDKLAPDMSKGASPAQKAELRTRYDEARHEILEDNIGDNSLLVMSQPDGDAGLIVIPSPSSLEDEAYRTKAASELSTLYGNVLSNIPGTSLDWAKMNILHELSHLERNDTDNSYNSLIQSFVNAKPDTNLDAVKKLYADITDETEADLNVMTKFNLASGASTNLLQAYADLRMISGYMHGNDLLQTEPHASQGQDGATQSHYTGISLQNFLETGQKDYNVEKEQTGLSYTNTLINGFVGITQMRAENDRQAITAGRSSSNSDIFAASKILLETGQFDNTPDVKKNVERFISAVEKYASGVIDRDKIEFFRQSISQPESQGLIDRLKTTYTPEPVAANKLSSVAPAPALAQ